jgi:hypothetical protein
MSPQSIVPSGNSFTEGKSHCPVEMLQLLPVPQPAGILQSLGVETQSPDASQVPWAHNGAPGRSHGWPCAVANTPGTHVPLLQVPAAERQTAFTPDGIALQGVPSGALPGTQAPFLHVAMVFIAQESVVVSGVQLAPSFSGV